LLVEKKSSHHKKGMVMLMKKKVIALSIAILLMISFSVPAYAYSPLGYKWSSSSITYYTSSSAKANTVTAFSLGASVWSNNTKVNITLNSSSYNIFCTDVYSTVVDWDGLCYYNYSGSYFTSITQTLNYYYTDSYVANKRISVAMHEFGHGLGLADLGTSSTSLMNGYSYYRYDINGVFTPQTDDINGVNSLY
jgi:hypothetical protein